MILSNVDGLEFDFSLSPKSTHPSYSIMTASDSWALKDWCRSSEKGLSKLLEVINTFVPVFNKSTNIEHLPTLSQPPCR